MQNFKGMYETNSRGADGWVFKPKNPLGVCSDYFGTMQFFIYLFFFGGGGRLHLSVILEIIFIFVDLGFS